MSPNKTIVRNTLFLYFRMFITLGIALYTSRVILRILGIEDFGIYNLVGGVVLLFSFLNGSMNSTTQRFINFEMTSNDRNQINKIFNISVTNHFFISLIVFVLAETIGLWFLNHQLNIDYDRMSAANMVYQLSILTTIVDIIRVPYNAIILANERMSYYAFVGIFETLSKLLIVFLLVLFPFYDHLVLYALLILFVNLATNLLVFFYCKKNFREETSFKFIKDWKKTKELLSFSGWMLFGQVTTVGATQGVSMVLNIFYGVVVNAALGIANQINGAIYAFVSNFQIAFNPQIVQSYASSDYQRNKQLILTTSKYSFFLMALLSAPILFFTKSILVFWLGSNLPQYVDSFVRIVILCSLIEALAGPFWMSAAAIGEMKKYNIFISLISVLTLPLVYLLLITGFNPFIAYSARFGVSICMLLFRYYYIHLKLNFEIKEFYYYLKGVIVVFGFLAILLLTSEMEFTVSFLQFIRGSVFVELSLILIMFFLGLTKKEKSMFLIFIKKYIRKKWR